MFFEHLAAPLRSLYYCSNAFDRALALPLNYPSAKCISQDTTEDDDDKALSLLQVKNLFNGNGMRTSSCFVICISISTSSLAPFLLLYPIVSDFEAFSKIENALMDFRFISSNVSKDGDSVSKGSGLLHS